MAAGVDEAVAERDRQHDPQPVPAVYRIGAGTVCGVSSPGHARDSSLWRRQITVNRVPQLALREISR
jgi:hypothetical protein